MTRSSLILVGVLTLVSNQIASAHPRGGRGAGFAGAISINRTGGRGGSFNAGITIYRAPASYYRPHYGGYRYWAMPSYYPTYYPSYYVPSYYSTGYQATSSVVVVKEPKARPDITPAKWDDENLIEFALNKFAFTRGLDRDGNKVIMEIVAKDFHGDTGALKKVKIKVRWVEIKVVKNKAGEEVREEKQKDTTIKLKFDEFGRFTEYCD